MSEFKHGILCGIGVSILGLLLSTVGYSVVRAYNTNKEREEFARHAELKIYLSKRITQETNEIRERVNDLAICLSQVKEDE